MDFKKSAEEVRELGCGGYFPLEPVVLWAAKLRKPGAPAIDKGSLRLMGEANRLRVSAKATVGVFFD